jgi:two-component system NarL family sensor kinase
VLEIPRRLLVAGAAPVLATVCVGLAALDDPVDHGWQWAVVVAALAFVLVPGVVSVLILRRYPEHRIGWLLALDSLISGIALAVPPHHLGSRPLLVLAQLSANWWVLLYLGPILIAYLFPQGSFASSRWRRWTQLCLAGYLIALVEGVGDPAFRDLHPDVAPPLPFWPQPVVLVMSAVALGLVAASLVGAVLNCVLRTRRATGTARLQLLWFSWASLSIPAVLGVCFLDVAVTGENGLITVLGLSVFGSVIPVAIGIAILRSRLFDIELVLSRTLTYGLLTAGVVGVYAAVLTLVEHVLGRGSIGGFLAVGIVAVAVQPAHARLRRRVERWVYGDRSDPGAAVRRMSERVDSTADPAGVVESVTASVAEALRVSRVWVERDGNVTADDRVVRVPLVHRGERLGDLAVAVPPGRDLSAADIALVHDLARHASVVVRAADLTADLQASRARLVTAREEERRRLRRDLHDGVGPSLAAIVLKLGAARNRSDEASRTELLDQTMEETRAAIAEVRRLVDDLRPPAIDEVGLIGAIRQRAASLSQGSELVVEVGGPAAVPPLPAAVEVAAFRIATEALTNVIRHSTASRCTIHVSISDGFELTVTDNGGGAALGTQPGVGWTSMSERAEELGGTCTVSSPPTGGLVVRAVLPLGPATAGVMAQLP